MNAKMLIDDLSEFINNPRKAEDDRFVQQIYFALDTLCKNQVDLKIKIIGTTKCSICSKLIEDSRRTCTLRCSHSFHRECIKRDLLVFTDNKPLETISSYYPCPKKNCALIAGMSTIKNGIFTKEEWEEMEYQVILPVIGSIRENDIIYRKKELESMTFQCPICSEDKLINSECITLECEHKICRTCLETELSIKLNDGKVMEEDRKCPIDPKCDKLIEFVLIENILSKENAEKYSERAFNNIRSTNPNEKYVRCPGADCKNIFLFVEGLSPFLTKCGGCKLEFCVNGCNKFHRGQTCAQYQQMQEQMFQAWKSENDQAEARFNHFVAANRLKRCPQCTAMVEKISGCDNMVCKCGARFNYSTGLRN